VQKQVEHAQMLAECQKAHKNSQKRQWKRSNKSKNKKVDDTDTEDEEYIPKQVDISVNIGVVGGAPQYPYDCEIRKILPLASSTTFIMYLKKFFL
jgi:hypothetical protein